MKHKHLFIVIFVLCVGSLSAQTRIGAILDTVTAKPSEALRKHYELLNQAQLAYVRGDLRKSAELSFQAHKVHRSIDRMPLSFAVFHVLPQIPLDSALLVGALEMIYRNTPILDPKVDTFKIMEWYTDSFFRPSFHIDRQWFGDYLQQFRYEPEKYSPEIAEVLDSLLEEDQQYRRIGFLWLKRRQSGEAAKIDSSNQQALINLFRKYPNFSAEASGDNLSAISTLLQHFAKNQYTDWYPYIKSYVLRGNIPNTFLVEYLDLYVFTYNKIHNIAEYDYYGTMRIFALSDRVVVVWPKRKELKKMNKRRDAVMLPSFQESVEIRLHHHFMDPHPFMRSIDAYDHSPGMENTMANHQARQQAIRKLEDEYLENHRKQYGKRRVKVYTMETLR
jgi:hypothetical protein